MPSLPPVAPVDHPISVARTLRLPRYSRFSYKKTARDIANFARYGRNAMLADETLYVNPQEVRWRIEPPMPVQSLHSRPFWSGHVLEGDWDLDLLDVTTTWKHKACVAHFRDGVPWADTDAFDRMMRWIAKVGTFDGCATLEDVKARYAKLDVLYEEVLRLQRLPRQKELPTFKRGEFGGIFGHIGRNGDFLRVRNGHHRFAIARLAGLTTIPVHVGLVHPNAVKSGVIKRLRNPVADPMKTDA